MDFPQLDSIPRLIAGLVAKLVEVKSVKSGNCDAKLSHGVARGTANRRLHAARSLTPTDQDGSHSDRENRENEQQFKNTEQEEQKRDAE